MSKGAFRLSELLADVPGARVVGDEQTVIAEVRDDSRQVASGDLFVAIEGTGADGRDFVADAIARGARAVVIEADGDSDAAGAAVGAADPAVADAMAVLGHDDAAPGSKQKFGGATVLVKDARLALARIAARRWDTRADLTLMAVTGTNGKTTTTYLLEAILAAARVRAGVIGTVAYRLNGGPAPTAVVAHAAPLTTPGALALHRLFAEMRDAGATDVVLEATSHALDQRRLDGCTFRVAGLTNLTQDHLDYHGSMERYLDAKALLFERLLHPRDGVAVLPVDRPEGRALKSRLRAGQSCLGYAMQGSPLSSGLSADIVVRSFTQTADGTRAHLATPIGDIQIASALVGDFNLSNIVLAAAMAIARGLTADAIERGIHNLVGVPGRMQRVANAQGVTAVVDYAHTPDALERAIVALRPLVAAPDGRLITVFGCGGGRDRGKRPLMGAIAMRTSDLVVVTSDNPRHEDPRAIIDAIVDGIIDDIAGGEIDAVGNTIAAAELRTSRRGFCVEPDRRTAIHQAVAASRAGDVLLLAGKGHENYQIIGDRRVHFDDVEEAQAAFGKSAAPSPAPSEAS